MTKQGTWWVRSESDPRWNCDGQGVVGGFELPPEARDALKRRCAELHEPEPPEDLHYGYMKD